MPVCKRAQREPDTAGGVRLPAPVPVLFRNNRRLHNLFFLREFLARAVDDLLSFYTLDLPNKKNALARVPNPSLWCGCGAATGAR